MLAAAALLAALAIAACGSSPSGSASSAAGGTSSGAGGTSSGAPVTGRGPVSVLYAGSLEALMNSHLGPAFDRATGYTFTGFPAGSSDLATEIKGRVRVGDVFISASPSVNVKLQGASNGNWVSWYAPFATTSLVLGYNPASRFAADLKRGPWYKVIAKPGFRLGFTDPKLDPKGVLAVDALHRAAALYHDPALSRIAGAQGDLFPEQDLVGRLQSGQLDAGFFYTVEASTAKVPTVTLGPIRERATYTVSVLARAPHQAGAEAFVKFLLGARGRALLSSVGLATLRSPTAVGRGVPESLTGAIRSPR